MTWPEKMRAGLLQAMLQRGLPVLNLTCNARITRLSLLSLGEEAHMHCTSCLLHCTLWLLKVQEAAAQAHTYIVSRHLLQGTAACQQTTSASQVQVLVPAGELERKRQQKEQQHWAYLNKGREVCDILFQRCQ